MSITIHPMIDTPRRQAARQPLNRRFQTPSRLIPPWNHEPGSRLIPRWTRLLVAFIRYVSPFQHPTRLALHTPQLVAINDKRC
jgi:hypothetical protein